MTDGSSPASAVLKDGNAVYTPGLSERRGTASKFYHGDALGSTRGITDSTQAVTDSQLYDAFGNTVSRTGTTPTPFGFVGKAQYQSDSDSGLQLLGHRYYDPSIGRFLSSDPIQDGNNWYAYCDNNPLIGVDPEGLSDEEVGSRGSHDNNISERNRGKHEEAEKRRLREQAIADQRRNKVKNPRQDQRSGQGDRRGGSDQNWGGNRQGRGDRRRADNGIQARRSKPIDISNTLGPDHYYIPTEPYYPPPPNA